MCFRDYIMDSGIALVFSVQLSVKLETAHKEYNETITICQFTYLPKRTVQNALVPEDIKGEFMHQIVSADMLQPPLLDCLVTPQDVDFV